MRVLAGRQHSRLQHPRVAEDGVEWRAQLVRERREELVLQPVRGLHVVVRASIVDGERRAEGHVLRKAKVVVGVEPARFCRRQRQSTQRSPTSRQGDDDVRPQAQRTHERQTFFVTSGGGHDHVVRDFLHHPG
jgi:hypothetical protein